VILLLASLAGFVAVRLAQNRRTIRA
jgi:hypothetical protein